MTITQTITALPTPPNPNTDDSTTFDSKASAFTQAMVTMGAELNTLAGQMNTEAANINAFVGLAMKYTFSTTTADADPGAGALRLGSATQNTATVVRMDLADANGNTVTAVLDAMDDSSSVHKGFLRLQHATDLTKWLLFNVASLASPAGYRNITVSIAASSAASPFADGDSVIASFVRTGDVAAGTVTSTEVQSQTYTAFTTGGSLTAYTLTPSPALASYAAGRSFWVNFHTACGNDATLQISGLATPPTLVKRMGSSYAAVKAGDIPAGQHRVTLISATQALVEDLQWNAGEVIQEVTGTDSGSTSSTTFASITSVAKAFTPKSANSKIIVEVSFMAAVNAVGGVVNVAYFQIVDGVTVVSSEYQLAATGGTGNGVSAPGTVAAIISNAALTARSFTLQCKVANASGSGNGLYQVWRIREVQQ